MAISLFKRQGRDYLVCTLRLEPATGRNYYGISRAIGHWQRREASGNGRKEIIWMHSSIPPLDVLIQLTAKRLEAGFHLRAPRGYAQESLTALERKVLRRAKHPVHVLQQPLFFAA